MKYPKYMINGLNVWQHRGWVDKIMQFNYTVRYEYMEGPVSDEWTKSDDEPSPIEELAEVTPARQQSPLMRQRSVEEPEDNTPLKEPESKQTQKMRRSTKADNSDEENSSMIMLTLLTQLL